MQPRRGIGTEDGDQSGSPPGRSHAEGPAPLVILSERGRHSDEARRIVRAQAARASAAQSRVTRARNREERESAVSDRLGTLQMVSWFHYQALPTPEIADDLTKELLEKPLAVWLSGALGTSLAALARTPSQANGTTTSPSPSQTANATSFSDFLEPRQGTGDSRPQLPLAVPRGFISLQQRIQISEQLMMLVSKTSCFDFDSPGVRERLQQLLVDQIVGYAAREIEALTLPGHPIQGYLRIACTCLTISECQRAEGVSTGAEIRYQRGLDAAWSEALLLDHNALKEPKAAEASLWSIFIISVTTRSNNTFFRPLLDDLFNDLQLHTWAHVRSHLVEFIYPVSFLDEPCKQFYDSLHRP